MSSEDPTLSRIASAQRSCKRAKLACERARATVAASLAHACAARASLARQHAALTALGPRIALVTAVARALTAPAAAVERAV